MSDFRKLDDGVYASPQIGVSDIAEAAALGVTLVINNRPEDESEDQTPGAEIETAAHAAGMNYIAIPVTMQTLSQADVATMAEALGEATGPVLAYCRSGTRSTPAVVAGRGHARTRSGRDFRRRRRRRL